MSVIRYTALPTMEKFHTSEAQIRAIVGSVGSGKTSAAAWEICHYLPEFLYEQHRYKKSRWVIVRNSYTELTDTTLKTVMGWFPWGHWQAGTRILTLAQPNRRRTVEILFRSCDRPEDMKKFKSLELTGYWIDESIEVSEQIKQMLKNRIGRYPSRVPVRWGIETTNPPDVEHPTYNMFAWDTPPPGPIPTGKPLENHVGFWQPPRENEENLRKGYYDDLINDYRDNPDWIDRYILGKPGIMVQGRLVYNNFKRDYHVAKEPLIWSKGTLYRGWDNSGNCPACVVSQVPTAGQCQILKEFCTDKEGIVDFARHVTTECNILYPGAEYVDYGDPAGANRYSRREGGFTSNAELMKEACGIDVESSEQNLTARIQSVDQQLARIDGLLIDPSCTRLINGFLGGYCYKEIGTTGTYVDKPLKNRFSHVADALQYVLVRLFRTQTLRKKKIGYNIRTSEMQENAWMGV